MRCGEVQDRLVAWDDDELSPGEATQVAEHVDGCPACEAHGRALRAATPRPDRAVPAHALRALRQRVDVDTILALADAEPAPQPLVARIRRFLTAETPIPRLHQLAYAALLFVAVGAAVTGWWSGPAAVTVAESASPLPSDQYEPASFRPSPAVDAPDVDADDGYR